MADIEKVRAQMAEVSREIVLPNVDRLESIGRVFWFLLHSAQRDNGKSGLEAQWLDLAIDNLETSIAKLGDLYSTAFATMTKDEKELHAEATGKSFVSLRSSLNEYWNEREKRLVTTTEKAE